jgi:hypothetical protein
MWYYSAIGKQAFPLVFNFLHLNFAPSSLNQRFSGASFHLTLMRVWWLLRDLRVLCVSRISTSTSTLNKVLTDLTNKRYPKLQVSTGCFILSQESFGIFFLRIFTCFSAINWVGRGGTINTEPRLRCHRFESQHPFKVTVWLWLIALNSSELYCTPWRMQGRTWCHQVSLTMETLQFSITVEYLSSRRSRLASEHYFHKFA